MEYGIIPGRPWFDSRGDRIQAHGGSIIEVDGRYYFYGENKENTVPGSGVWHNGVNCYSSKDLINWTFENTILKAADDERHPLHPSRIMDRPHIIYNEKNKEYVMWMKLVGSDEEPRNWKHQYMGIAISKTITGEFKLIDRIVPLDMSSGDFDLFVDEDKKAFLIFGKVHTEIVIADLASDYKNVTGHYSTHLHFIGPPIAREAPAVFKRGRWYYMITSGTTGYYPNRALAARAEQMHGPWYITGDPCIGDKAGNTFNSQISSVFSVPQKDFYLAVGDRWVPDLNREHQKSSWNINTSIAQYVWLPVTFEEDVPKIEWKSQWNPEI